VTNFFHFNASYFQNLNDLVQFQDTYGVFFLFSTKPELGTGSWHGFDPISIKFKRLDEIRNHNLSIVSRVLYPQDRTDAHMVH